MSKEVEWINIKVMTREKDDLSEFVSLLKTIEYLCSVGSSRTIKVYVDGDGSGDMKFDFGETDVSGIKPKNPDDAKVLIGE